MWVLFKLKLWRGEPKYEWPRFSLFWRVGVLTEGDRGTESSVFFIIVVVVLFLLLLHIPHRMCDYRNTD